MAQDKPEKAKPSLKLKPLFSLLQRSNVLGLLLSSLACLLHAGIASVMNVDLQTAPSALFSPVVTVQSWDIKLTGDRKPPDTMTLHNPKEGSPAPAFMDRLVFVQKINQSLQTFLYWRSPALITTVSGMSGAGGGDDDGNDHSRRKKFELEPQAEWFAWAPDSLIQCCLKQKKRLLKILHQKMQWAQACGNRELARILHDRIMLIEIDRDFLQQQTSYSAPLFQTQEWLLRDSQEIQLYDQQHYDQVVNGRDFQTLGYFFLGKRGWQVGSGGSDTLGSGLASKSSVQTGIGSRQNGADLHHPSAVLSSHILSSHILSSHKGDERGDEPPPAKKARLEPADSIFCSLCQNTLNEQEVTRVLRGSTAEPVVCDVCLHSASQALPQALSQEITGKRKVTRKITRPDQAAPEPKPGKSQPGKRKQNSNRQDDPAAKRARLEPQGMEAQYTTDTVEELKALQQHLVFKMSAQEIEVTKQLFEHLKNKKIKVKATFHKLLSKVDRKKLPKFCSKVTVFFGSVTTITDTGCLTCMLKSTKKHIRDFAEREDSELKYLAGLDTLRSFSSINNNKGLPKQDDVKEVLSWPEWKDEDDQFSMELFRAFSCMNRSRGLPEQHDVKEVLSWPEWKDKDGQFSMELFRAFSSMNNGKGFPKQNDVKKVLGWPEWKDEDRQFSMELFRAFSSMNGSRGLPQQHDVKEVLDWLEWKEDGQFSMELFRAFSSINHGKGLPKQHDVKEVLSWPEWREGGQFSMKRFRAFSSMNHGKGLPKQDDVKKVLSWPEWKDEDGQFSMELFRAFSSMNSSRGLPEQHDVKEVLSWPEWKDKDGQFSMELFRAFSSMNNGKGLPKQNDVKKVLGWPEWKDEDRQFSMELFRAFSSMNSSRGLPQQHDVKEVLDWPEWKDEDRQFSMELFRAFSSMNSSRGLPQQHDVKEVLDWPEWKEDGQFSMELFRAFSSMNSSRGLPEQHDVKEVLSWPEWKDKDGQFSMELFRAFSSMNNGKGLPKQNDVKKVLGWPEWKDEDRQFSMELFRAFSSMNSSRGLPQQHDVKEVLGWPEWKEDGRFSMERFRAFSSMNNGKGLPKQNDVKKVLGWPEWKEDGRFSMERFRSFSSINHGKGLPKQDHVREVLGWPEWKEDGRFSMERFRSFSSMNNGKGLPKQNDVKKVLGWLTGEGQFNASLLKLMSRLYASEGIPDIKNLRQYEQKLSELFFANTVTDLESDDEDEQSCLIRQVALYLSTRKLLYSLNFKNVEQFHQQVASDADRRLEKLLTLLISYGGAGVNRYLALNDNNRKALLSTCTSRIPLPLAIKAINDFSPSQRKQYLFFSKNLKPPPEKEQWNGILQQLHRLASVLKTPHAQRFYLEVVWSLAPSDRDVFLDETRAAPVKKVFPSLNTLKKLAKKHSRQWLKELLEACLQYGQGTLSGDSIKRLFAALLETQHPMFGHGDIPDHFLSGYTEIGDSAIFIPVTPPTQTTDELALHFVASVMEVLSDMFYDYKANTLKIEQYGGEIHTFPAPELKIHHKGLVISHWTGEVFNRFLAVTEFPEHYYFSKEAWQQHCTPEVPGYFQRRTAACHQRERAAPDTHTFQPLSIPALMGLLKNNINITSAAWKSFDHHKDRLPRAAHSRLLSEIEKASHEDIPVSLRDYLEAKRPPPEKEKLPQSEMAAPTSTPPFTVVETLSEEEQFRRLWADLSRKELLVAADLELLAGYKEYMTMEHIVDLLKRADAIMEPYRLDELRQFLGEKRDLHSRNDPLLLDLTDEVVSYLIEAEI